LMAGRPSIRNDCLFRGVPLEAFPACNEEERRHELLFLMLIKDSPKTNSGSLCEAVNDSVAGPAIALLPLWVEVVVTVVVGSTRLRFFCRVKSMDDGRCSNRPVKEECVDNLGADTTGTTTVVFLFSLMVKYGRMKTI
jgi:hypothetical protein